MDRNLELLISSLEKDPRELAADMHIECDAVVVNQGAREERYGFSTAEGINVRVIESRGRGVGESRNTALDEAEAGIVLFSDDDIVYSKGYAGNVLQAFDSNPQADIIMFNVDVAEDRRTYYIDRKIRVHKWSVGRYPAYAAAARLESLRKAGVRFSLLFGGGAEYSCGEDSLFFMDCLKAGLVIKGVPVTIGREVPGESTWFRGYNAKFFKDRGVLYHYMYGSLAGVWALRFVLAKRRFCKDGIKPAEAFRLMREGIREGKSRSK